MQGHASGGRAGWWWWWYVCVVGGVVQLSCGPSATNYTSVPVESWLCSVSYLPLELESKQQDQSSPFLARVKGNELETSTH